MEFDKVQDSGERHQFDTGSQRDMQEGKGRFDLIPFEGLLRIAKHFEAGAKKYDDNNWRKGQPLNVYCNSAARHLFKYIEGWRDEDHLAAACWNLLCAIHTEEAIEKEELPEELANLLWQKADREAKATEVSLKWTDEQVNAIKKERGKI